MNGLIQINNKKSDEQNRFTYSATSPFLFVMIGNHSYKNFLKYVIISRKYKIFLKFIKTTESVSYTHLTLPTILLV